MYLALFILLYSKKKKKREFIYNLLVLYAEDSGDHYHCCEHDANVLHGCSPCWAWRCALKGGQGWKLFELQCFVVVDSLIPCVIVLRVNFFFKWCYLFICLFILRWEFLVLVPSSVCWFNWTMKIVWTFGYVDPTIIFIFRFQQFI